MGLTSSGLTRALLVPTLISLLSSCASAPPRKPSAPVARLAAPVVVAPQRDWADAVIYFAITDRFADGDPTNDVGVDRAAKGTFHGGDVKGLIEQLDGIAALGATAIWITPVVKNIDGFVSGAGFPDWAYHGYWADDFTRLDPRFGTEEDLKTLVAECHRRGIKVFSTSSTTTRGTSRTTSPIRRPRVGCGPRHSAPVVRMT
jgi:pullulanase/glycogen debranching enzyme